MVGADVQEAGRTNITGYLIIKTSKLTVWGKILKAVVVLRRPAQLSDCKVVAGETFICSLSPFVLKNSSIYCNAADDPSKKYKNTVMQDYFTYWCAISKSRHISCALSVVYCEWECVNRPDICSISKLGRLNQPVSIRAPLKSTSLDVSFTLTRHL